MQCNKLPEIFLNKLIYMFHVGYFSQILENIHKL